MFASIILCITILNLIFSFGFSQNSTWATSNAQIADWINLVSDGSGKNLVAASYYPVGSQMTGISVSNDFGKSWTNIFISGCGLGLPWTAATINTYGSNIYALQQNLGLFTSFNGGKSWDRTIIDSALTYASYNSVAVNSNGDIVYVTISFGYIYYSNNFGRTFTRTSAPTNVGWMQVATSGSGQYVAAVADVIYISSNYGSTWQKTSTPSLGWYSIHFSSDGNNVVAAAAADTYSHYTGGIYVSSDFGRSWSETSADRSLAWRTVTSDSTGQKLYAAVSAGSIYYSVDHGKTFQKSASAPSGESWRGIATDASGNYFSVASYGNTGNIYYSVGI